jgi:hypothetical protein
MKLCMDFTSKGVKVAVVGKERKKFKVVTSREFALSDLAGFFGEHLPSMSKNVDEIRVSCTLEKTFHKLFVVPNLKKNMLDATIEAEVLKASGGAYQFRYEPLGEVPGPGNKVNRKIMAVGVSRDGLEEISQMFDSSRVKPNLYGTYPVSVQALLKKLDILSDEPLAFVDLHHSACRIAAFKGEEIRLTRELPVPEGRMDTGDSGLAKDIYRTLLFYNDTYPEERLTRLVLAGVLDTSEIGKNLSAKTGAEIIPFNPSALFDGLEESQVYPGCLGLTLLDEGSCNFTFVPISVQEKRKVKKLLTLSSTACLGVALIFVMAISRFSMDLRDLNAFHGGIKGEIKMKQDRLKEMPLEFISQSIETTQPPWSEVLLELAAVVPSGVALKTLTLKNIKRIWRGEVTGIADGSDEINSLLQVEELQNNFSKSPLFTSVKLIERELQGKQVAFKIIYQLDVRDE